MAAQVSVDLFESEKPQDDKTSVNRSRDQPLGKRCHRSISKSDDEQRVFLLCQLSNRLASFHWHKIDAKKKKTAHAFWRKPARTLINIPPKELNFCIIPFWELWSCRDEGLPTTSAPFLYSTRCRSAMLLFFPASLTGNRVWWKGEQAKRAKINILFYLMGWSAVVMRQGWKVEEPVAKIFSRRVHAEIHFVTFSQPPLPWQQSHRDEQSHLWGHASRVTIIETTLIMMLTFALLLTVATIRDPFVKSL